MSKWRYAWACDDCGGPVREFAKVCPHCGFTQRAYGCDSINHPAAKRCVSPWWRFWAREWEVRHSRQWLEQQQLQTRLRNVVRLADDLRDELAS